MLSDLTKYRAFRVMPSKVHDIADIEGSPVIRMTYCEPMDASCWVVEGVQAYDPESPRTIHEQLQDPEVDEICECTEQFTAYMIMDLLEQERIQQVANDMTVVSLTEVPYVDPTNN